MTRRPAAPAVLGLELQPAQLAAGQRGPLECVVLFAGEQVPEQHTELSGGRHERDLRSAAGTHALIEGAQRTGVLISTQAASQSMWRASGEPCFEMRPSRAGASPD